MAWCPIEIYEATASSLFLKTRQPMLRKTKDELGVMDHVFV